MLKIYNTLTNSKDLFEPLVPGVVGIYVCGITVYDYCHIGHARSMIIFDMVVRYLRSQGYHVNYVRNITDVDDKIIKRALENNQSCSSLTEFFIEKMHEDEASLGLLPPDYTPRATVYMPQMITLIEQLLAKGYAYIAENGDVYYSVRNFASYGKLSHRNLDQLQAGSRIEISNVKQDPLDFVLWKLAKPDEETKWASPWGEGRPGWHTECAAMSADLLDLPFDIHGGGLDLKFPHHENEIAQSEAACDKDFAKIWMHVGLLQINQEKMSKSLGNFYTIREVLEEYHTETIRFFMISSHYRSPVNYSKENLSQSHNALVKLYSSLRDLPVLTVEDIDIDHPLIAPFYQQFQTAMNDDFNTPEAISILFKLSHDIQKLKEANQIESAIQLAKCLQYWGKIFGILQQDPDLFIRGKLENFEEEKIKTLIIAREQARQKRNWQEADRYRDQLEKMDILIEDGPEGTRWRHR